MIDLIAAAERDGDFYIIPSALFVAKCLETRQTWDAATRGPLPPD